MTITKQELTTLYVDEGMTGDEIAQKLGVGRGVVYRHLRKHGIKSRASSSYQSKKHYTESAHYQGVGELSSTTWTRIKNKAETRNITVSCTAEEVWNLFLDQDRKCVLTGVELYLAANPSKSNASLDRIDSKKPYELGNIQWVYKPLNLMKSTTNNEEFIKLCQMVATHSQK